MKTLRQHLRLVLEGSVGVTLIVLSVPAIWHALRAFNYRVTVSIFVALAALTLIRDPQAIARITTAIRNRRNRNGR